MEERIMEEWKGRNELLQQAYNEYRFASSKRDKDVAFERVKINLKWDPFIDFCFNHGTDVYGINSKYGFDTLTEECIGLIDKIAKDEMVYDY